MSTVITIKVPKPLPPRSEFLHHGGPSGSRVGQESFEVGLRLKMSL